jgi:hypothetical protein
MTTIQRKNLYIFMQAEKVRQASTQIAKNQAAVDKMIDKLIIREPKK